jgi:hypothetical protein
MSSEGVMVQPLHLSPSARLALPAGPVARWASCAYVVALALTWACSDVPLVRVDGLAVRGPTQPVCMPDVACDAPFSAGFTAFEGSRVVTRFRSGADGRFTIHLAPGEYDIRPDADAPILDPTQQVKSVSVPAADSISIVLSFDTGIR